MAGQEAVRSAVLAGLVRPASDYADPVTSAGSGGLDRVLPVLPELRRVLPGRGLRRGSTIGVLTGRSVRPAGGSSLVLALLVEASRSGAWCAVVGIPTFGAVAAADTGIALDRLALVPYPGPEWPTVVATLADGFDVVVVAAPETSVAASVAGRLAARARQRGCVLVAYGGWAGVDVSLGVVGGVWEGLGQGWGRLRCRQVTVVARGRGAAARPKEVTVWMPAESGRFGAARRRPTPVPAPTPFPAITPFPGPVPFPGVSVSGPGPGSAAGLGSGRPTLALVTDAATGTGPLTGVEAADAPAAGAEEAV